MSRRILFVFEGEKQEVNYSKSFIDKFFSPQTIILTSFCNDLYELWKSLSNDADLDMFELLKEIKINKQLADIEDRDVITEIYLFFDLEIQDNQFSFEKLRDMLLFFNEETTRGKLFISYPMIEAIRDVPDFDGFINHFIDVDKCVGSKYKSISAERGMKDLAHAKKITRETWVNITKASVLKVRALDAFDHSDENKMQVKISHVQEEIFNESSRIAVLSSFPLFLYDYFGSSEFNF
jgi:hypothetical protein